MITLQEKIFSEESGYITFEKYFEESKLTLGCKVKLGNNWFQEYQEGLFQDMLWDLVEFIQSDDFYYEDVKGYFEHKLQDLNTKLQVFAEKMKQDERFSLSWVMHIVKEDQYISALIWDASLMIFRDDKLIYTVGNEISQWNIDQFSEFIEGDFQDDDRILIWGSDINMYLDKDDLDKVLKMSAEGEWDFIAKLLEVLSVRIEESKLWFYQDLTYSSGKKLTQRKLKKWIGSWFSFLSKQFSRLDWYGTLIQYGIAGAFVLILLVFALSWFTQTAQTTVKDAEGNILVDYSIQDIQKEIAVFKQINANSNEKVKRYNEIMTRLNTLESEGKWVFDVKELKNILEQEYKEWFNIALINSLDLLGDPVYAFTQQEKNYLGSMKKIMYNKWFMVWWEDGVLIWAVSEKIRWSLVSSGIWYTLEECHLNLLKNGLFCSASDWSIYSTDKVWFTPVTTDDNKFPRAISWLGTFRTSNMYVLTNDDRINKDWVYVIRYKNKDWSQAEFGEGIKYNLSESFTSQNPWAFDEGGVSSFAIDGTFLMWSAAKSTLYQLRREGTSQEFVWREVSLEWGDTVSVPFSPDTQIFASAESKYISLFDNENQTFTVYLTDPIKTVIWNDKNRNPKYFFQLRFNLDENLEIIDVFIEEGEKSNIYLLTKEFIYKMPLHQYIDQYEATLE